MSDELSRESAFSVNQLLVEGRYAPNATELLEELSKLDLVEEFKDTRLVDKSIFTLSFDSQNHAHLFALYLGAEGHRKGDFMFALSDSFFHTDLLEDFRPDGVVLSLFERERDYRHDISIVLKQGGAEYRGKLTDLVEEVISSSMPHLAAEVSNLTL